MPDGILGLEEPMSTNGNVVKTLQNLSFPFKEIRVIYCGMKFE